MNKDNKYQCARCGNIYEKVWSDEEANAEAEEIFGKHPDDWNCEKEIICDDCFQEINPSNHPEELSETKKYI